MHDAVQSLRWSAKHLRLSLVITLVVSVAVGATTAVFSVITPIFFGSLPYKDANQLAIVALADRSGPAAFQLISYPVFEEWRSRSSAFQDLALYLQSDATAILGSEPELVQTAQVEAPFFSMLGVRPMLGRAWGSAGERENVLVLSHSLWTTRFGRSRSILSRSVVLDGAAYQIIGVMPEGFAFPNRDIQMWRPLVVPAPLRTAGSAFWANVAGRLRPNISPEIAQRDLALITSGLHPRFPALRGKDVRVTGLRSSLAGDARVALILLGVAVGCVLLMASANLAGLVLAHAETRRREFAVRLALGASRVRLLGQVLLEMAPSVTAGGLLGVVVAHGLRQAVLSVAPIGVRQLGELTISGGMLGLSIGATVLAALACSTFVATGAGRRGRMLCVAGSTGVVAGVSSRSGRGRLIVFEAALAVLLLSSTGLLLQTLWNLHRQHEGFSKDAALTLTARLSPLTHRQPDRVAATTSAILDRLRTLPGVRFAEATVLVMSNEYDLPMRIEPERGQPSEPERRATVGSVSPGYFQSLSVPLRAGRWFTDADRSDSLPAAVVNETAGRLLWPGRDPVGERFAIGRTDANPRWFTVVGVVGDMRRLGAAHPPTSDVFLPLAQRPSRGLTLVVGVAPGLDPLVTLPSVRTAVWSLAPDAAMWDVRTLQDRAEESLATRRFLTATLLFFAVVALFLAGAGMYGLVANGVATRTREMGLRLALGGTPAAIARLVVGESLRLALAGAMIGTLAALFAAKAFASMLYGVKGTSLLPPLAAGTVLAVASLLASLPAARYAGRTDPVISLRTD